MALRIEIAKMYNNKLEVRIGDLDGSATMGNITKEEALSDISNEIDDMLKKEEEIKDDKSKNNHE